MNYAQQELDRTTTELQSARAAVAALRAVLEGPYKPQQITLTTVAGAVTVALPAFDDEEGKRIAASFYNEVSEYAEQRVIKLRAEQLSWCREVVLVEDQQQEADAAREAARA